MSCGSDIHRLVAAQSEAEDAALELDETETSFATVIGEYETRMPEIIKSIRKLNMERITQFKCAPRAKRGTESAELLFDLIREGITKWTNSKREIVSSMAKNLDLLTEAVNNINSEKDLLTFSEGTTDFWQVARLRGDSGVLRVRRAHAHVKALSVLM